MMTKKLDSLFNISARILFWLSKIINLLICVLWLVLISFKLRFLKLESKKINAVRFCVNKFNKLEGGKI